MTVVKRKKQRGSLLLRAAILAFAAYALAALLNQQIRIGEKRRELESVKQEIQVQEIRNEDLKQALSAGAGENKDYIERVAREGLNLARPGERVFVNISGN